MNTAISRAAAYTYDLPRGKIAQRPCHPADAARMLVANPETETITDSCFKDVDEFLKAGDILVFNNSRVIPARLLGKQAGREIEILLLEENSPLIWRAIGRPLKKIKPGTEIDFSAGLSGRLKERLSEREILIEFNIEGGAVAFKEWLNKKGLMPIPPYIRAGRSDNQDRSDYQTFFAEIDGSAAAPTASLHFTPSLFEAIKKKGVEIEYVTLHVGPPSFLPLIEGPGNTLSMPGTERYYHDPDLLKRLIQASSSGRRIIAVGTTVVRTLESMALNKGSEAGWRRTDLFITPGYSFKVVRALVTNFHQPGTSHLLLVQALTGLKLLDKLYKHALNSNYRFLSYGDGMFITSIFKG
ncbi:MAG: tRNA preQ1(34) S-adenosylmethionine ribosyltransferase-isomerase QueA [Candidatus Dadabacteria bacterium]|nr:MAG: tRNA preQ1(34) S-adenosylmethionine ribosyltransferase-isomerase QueA [Candidatus Dadabacteria bacterium]